MLAQYDHSALSTASTGKVVILAILVANPLMQTYDKYEYPHLSLRNTENVLINATGSTGSADLFQKDIANFYKISSFAKKFIQEQVAVPPEFNKFFQENFWDLLA